MRIQQLLTIASLLLTGNLALGETLDKDDVPTRCWDVCGPVVGVSHQCDDKFDNDAKQRECICQWKQAPTLVPLCEACITQYHNETRVGDNDRDHDDDNDNDNDNDNDHDNDHDDGNDNDHDHDHDHDGKRKRNVHSKRDNDANEILRDCKFSTTSYTPSAATSAVGSASTLAPRVAASATGSSASSSGGSSGSSSSSSAGASSSSNGVTPDSMASGFAPRAAPLAAIVGLMALVLM